MTKIKIAKKPQTLSEFREMLEEIEKLGYGDRKIRFEEFYLDDWIDYEFESVVDLDDDKIIIAVKERMLPRRYDIDIF